MEDRLPWGAWGEGGKADVNGTTLSDIKVKDGVMKFTITSRQANGSSVANNFGDLYNVYVRKWGTEDGYPMVVTHGHVLDNFDSTYSVTAAAPFVGEYTVIVELANTACDAVREEGFLLNTSKLMFQSKFGGRKQNDDLDRVNLAIDLEELHPFR